MAFNELPQIDRSAKHSDLSERRFTESFNFSTGFIPRPDVPDKGCDFDLELIVDGKDATNWRFPVQLKSIEELTLIDNDSFLSYSFQTSRLGYLMKRQPAMGLIVLYDVAHDISYYAFADEIYQHLCLERESDEWKKQAKVNIHIPVDNVLTTESVRYIHHVFTNRFIAGEKMLREQGAKYGLPAISFTTGLEYDFTQSEDIKRFLTEYGMLMISNYNLDMLYEMISVLPNEQIYGNRELMFMAAVVYGESGLHPDSNLFIEKLKRQSLTESEHKSLQFVHLKNQLALGYIDHREYVQTLRQMIDPEKNDANTVIIQLNILRYELAEYSALEENGNQLLARVNALFAQIEEAGFNPRQKVLMTLWNMDNLSFVINHIVLERTSEIHIKESLGAIIPLEEKRKYILETLQHDQQFNTRINAVNRFATENKDELIKAYSMALHVHHFTQKMVPLLSFGKNIGEMQEVKRQIDFTVQAAATAYTIFHQQHLYKDAYNSLCGMIEMQQFGVKYFPASYTEGHSIPELLRVKKQMEEQFGLAPYHFTLDSIPSPDSSADNDINLSSTAKLSDKEIEVLAEYMRDSLHLPNDRLINIKQELMAYRLFNQRCKDPNFIILTFKRDYEQKHPYLTPVRFVLRSKKTNLETLPSSDMEILLQSIGY